MFLLTRDDLICKRVAVRDLRRFSELDVCLMYDFCEPESLPDVPVVPLRFWDSFDSLVTVLNCVVIIFLGKMLCLD